MAKTTFSGPVRSRNGFQHVDSVGSDFTTRGGLDMRRYTLEEYWKQRPALNAVIGTAFSNADATNAANTAIRVAEMIANKDFEVLGTNMTTALVTFSATRSGIVLTTAGADEDQAILAPHLDTNQSAWQVTEWGTENQVQWEASVSTGASIADIKIWAGLKLTNDQLIATDADQAYFLFETDGDNGTALTDFTLLHFVYSVGGVDYISALPVTVAAATTYHLRIEIDDARKATIFVNGVQYDVSNTSGSTGGTAVASVNAGRPAVKSNALTNDIDLIPYVGVESGAVADAIITVHYQGISRIHFE